MKKSREGFTQSTKPQSRRACVGAILLLTGYKCQRGEEGEISKGRIRKCLYNHAYNSDMGGEKTQKYFKEGTAIHRSAF